MTLREPGPSDRRSDSIYRGRFAPSPTGPLHFGSLVTATASYLQAMVAGGEWLLRIENIDPPREMPNATEQIVATLLAHDFEWSGDILYQGDSRFDTSLRTLLEQSMAFACTCSRKQVQAQARFTGTMGPVYPGTCRDAGIAWRDTENLAIRMRVGNNRIAFDDHLYGHVECALASEIGDFVIRRADGLIAYALAVVVDDHEQNITEVVRGADLLDFTPAHIYLQRILGLATPEYFHIPVAVNQSGVKLSKQTGATPVDDSQPAENLVRCLEFLKQEPPASLSSAPPAEVWNWARANWHPGRLATMVKNDSDQAE